MKRGHALLSLLALALLVLTDPASATHTHPSHLGPNVDFSSIEETTNSSFGTADPEPLLGTMTPVGDTLTWSPTDFNATGSGGTFDEDHTTLQVTMDALTPGALDVITINEAGFVDLSGAGGAATGAFLGMAGTLTVTAGGNVEVFTFGDDVADALVSFSAGMNPPGDGGGALFDLVTNPGMTSWTATVTFDLVALLGSRGVLDSATQAVLSYNDTLQAFSEVGSDADAWKTSAAIIVPEPVTGILLASGLVILGIRARRNRYSV